MGCKHNINNYEDILKMSPAECREWLIERDKDGVELYLSLDLLTTDWRQTVYENIRDFGFEDEEARPREYQEAIYKFVEDNYGQSEADEPSYDIELMAVAIAEHVKH
jgi:hypothetical protein